MSPSSFLRPTLLLSLLVSALLALGAEGAPPAAHRLFANGLEAFVVENHTVPLVTVCVVFRGGASAQEADTAGLFHLYEHMLFASNEKYPNQAAFTAALNSLGVTGWNGSTGEEYINYYITLPSDKLGDGVEFWSWAVRHPVFDPAKLEAEKGVVLAEIGGYHADPGQIYTNAFESRAFPARPWRRNVDGPEAVVKAATVEKLAAMRDTWYVPGNAAVLIGGDVAPEAAFAAVERFFGDWKGRRPPPIGVPPQESLPAGVRLIYQDPGYYEGVADVRMAWRGPDLPRDLKDTYAADVLLFLTNSPVGKFKKALMAKVPGLYAPEYISLGYPTARDGGLFYFDTYMRIGDYPSLPDRAETLRAALLEELALVAKDPVAYFGEAELAKAKRKLVDDNLYSMENPASFVTGTLVFWWAVASADYFFGYEANCAKVGFDDIASLIRRYFLGANSEVALRINAADARGDPGVAKALGSGGWEEITAANAFWWMRK